MPLLSETTGTAASRDTTLSSAEGAEPAAAAGGARIEVAPEEAAPDGDVSCSESGLAWLGGPPADAFNGSTNGNPNGSFAVRVLLIDERLLACRRSACSGHCSGKNKDENDVASVVDGPVSEGGEVVPGRTKTSGAVSGRETEGGRGLGLKGGGGIVDPTPTTGASSSEKTAGGDVRPTTCTGVSGSPSSSAAASVMPLLLAGLASLAESSPRDIFYSCSSGLGDASSSCASVSGDPQRAHSADNEQENGELPVLGEADGDDVDCPAVSRGLGRGGCSSDIGRDTGSWFSQEELLGKQDCSDGGGGDDEALEGERSSSTCNGGPVPSPRVDGDAAGADDDAREVAQMAVSTNGSSAAAEQSASALRTGDRSDGGIVDQVKIVCFVEL